MPDTYEEEEVDADDEWLGFNDIFSPAPLVPPGADSFEFPLPDGRVLHLTQSVAAFTRRDGDTEGAATAGADCARNTSALIWDASVVIASYLRAHHASLLPKGASVVELGAGMGLAGLTSAALGYRTTLTDRAEALPGLRSAVERNLLQEHARVAELSWGDADAARSVRAVAAQADDAAEAQATVGAEAPPVGCLLLADLLYELPLLEPLLSSMRALAGPATCILLAYDLAIHRPAVYAAFATLSEVDFEWHELEGADLELKPSVRLVRLQRREASAPAAADAR